jgi:hypothetical protein
MAVIAPWNLVVDVVDQFRAGQNYALPDFRAGKNPEVIDESR